ncbi:MAG: single-stranded DNA-binding protein [Burkholderiales bacterium]|nr:single-stranded DNA-binding protein [Burkholderiales bacterium]
MSFVNKVILIGNLGRAPEMRYAPSGAAVCSVSIATTRQWKDKSGEKREETEWHRVVFYDRLAEIAGEYLKKGRPVYVEGRLKYGRYTDKDGVERYTTDIVATEMQMLGGRGEAESTRETAPGARSRDGSPNTYAAAKDGQRRRAPPADAGGNFDDERF